MIQTRGRPSRVDEKATVRPSGETAGEASRPEKVTKRNEASPFVAGARRPASQMPASASSAPSATSPTRSARRPQANPWPASAAASATLLLVLVVTTASSARARSWVERKRSSGRFSRQRRTMRSRAGDSLADDSSRLGGSSLRMALSVSTIDSPWKARLPVSIS